MAIFLPLVSPMTLIFQQAIFYISNHELNLYQYTETDNATQFHKTCICRPIVYVNKEGSLDCFINYRKDIWCSFSRVVFNPQRFCDIK